MILKENLLHNDNKEIYLVLRFLNSVKEKFYDKENKKFDIDLINKYVEKIIEIDGKIDLLCNYIEAYQYFFVFGYGDVKKIYDEKNFTKRKEIKEYERLYAVTGKGKWIIDKWNNLQNDNDFYFWS